MGKTARMGGILFGSIYLLFLGLFLCLGTITSTSSAIDDTCSTFVVGAQDESNHTVVVKESAAGKVIGNYENRNEFCYYFHQTIFPALGTVVLSPFMYLLLFGCAFSGCSIGTEFALGTIGAIMNLSIWAVVGMVLGKYVPTIFVKDAPPNI